MVPNSVILNLAVIPLREPERVEMRARFDAAVSPEDVQHRLAESITVPTRYPPDISLEELDGDELVLKIAATPVNPADGAQLAAEVLEARAAGRRTAPPETHAAGEIRRSPADSKRPPTTLSGALRRIATSAASSSRA